MTHAFYCGEAPSRDDIDAALRADDIASQQIGDITTPDGRDAVADLMAYMVAQGGVIALYQGAAETGPRALGHRSILANPCDPESRAAQRAGKISRGHPPAGADGDARSRARLFRLHDGASDADYNAYNYMVLTARSKPHARDKIPPWFMPTAPAASRSCARRTIPSPTPT